MVAAGVFEIDWLSSASQTLLHLWQSISNHISSPNKRFFWGYLLSTVVLMVVVYRIEYLRTGTWSWRHAFGKKVWLHQSSILDGKIWFINLFIKIWIITPLLFTVAPIAIGTHNFLQSVLSTLTALFYFWFEPSQMHSFNLENSPEWVVLSTFTVLLFLLDDFTRFLLHWLMHRVPFLWSFHKLHHSAEVLTPVTVYRTHPIESFLYAARLLTVNGIVIGVGVFVFSSSLKFYDIAGANIGVFLFNMMGSNLRHSQVFLSWGSRLESWLISPAQHQIHHSIASEHRDKNFGTALAVWDRCFGTLVKAQSIKTPNELTFGVKNYQPSSLLEAYIPALSRGKQ